jgi:hypothetical protein
MDWARGQRLARGVLPPLGGAVSRDGPGLWNPCGLGVELERVQVCLYRIARPALALANRTGFRWILEWAGVQASLRAKGSGANVGPSCALVRLLTVRVDV